MAEELDLEIVEERYLTNAEAYEMLKKAIDRIMKKEGSIPHFLSKTLEYLKKFSKVEPESAKALRQVLEKYGLREETIIMIINICPKTVDEIRPLLELEEKVIETETVEELVEAVKPYCKES